MRKNRVSRWSFVRGVGLGIADPRSWLILALLFCTQLSHAQYLGNTGLQTVEVPKVFNAVNSAQTSANIQNLGQTIHILNYTVAGSPTLVQIRLEGSWDGVNFVPISDDATDLASGEVVGLGFYPAIRANLLQCVTCGAVTLTANYSGHFAGPATAGGFYNPSQVIRKVVLANAPMVTSTTIKGISVPYGVTSGILVISPVGTFNAASSISISTRVGEFTNLFSNTNLNSSNVVQIVPTPVTPGTSVDVAYSGAASAGTFSVYLFLYAPGTIPATAQPPITSNQEVTAVNATATVTITPSALQVAYLYSVSARCSAGTAGLTVSTAGTQIWSSGATEVGTTTFRFQWNPGLAGLATSAVARSIVVSLTTCGAANTGTLDVEASTL